MVYVILMENWRISYAIKLPLFEGMPIYIVPFFDHVDDFCLIHIEFGFDDLYELRLNRRGKIPVVFQQELTHILKNLLFRRGGQRESFLWIKLQIHFERGESCFLNMAQSKRHVFFTLPVHRRI